MGMAEATASLDLLTPGDLIPLKDVLSLERASWMPFLMTNRHGHKSTNAGKRLLNNARLITMDLTPVIVQKGSPSGASPRTLSIRNLLDFWR